MSRLRLLAACSLAIMVGACADPGPGPSTSPAATIGRGATTPSRTIDKRIEYHRARIDDYPRHYQARALLGAALLERARSSHDPADLQAARVALRESLAIQPSFQAYKTRAAVSNFGHRFRDGLHWGGLAAQANPSDSSVTAIMVEAEMGLGRYDEAARRLPIDGPPPTDFHVAAALGQWLASQQRFESAADAFSRAAELARTANVPDLVVWAEVQAAGVLLDGGHTDRARPHLDAAAQLNPSHILLRIHRAEWLEATGRSNHAIETLQTILTESHLQSSTPHLHMRRSRKPSLSLGLQLPPLPAHLGTARCCATPSPVEVSYPALDNLP